MTEDLSKKRSLENEATFRNENEKARRTLQGILPPRQRIYFVCECANISCTERIPLTGKQFSAIHQNSSSYFTIKPGHQAARIERVIKQTDKYYIVEKLEEDS